ncbi:hypothetical protein EDB92DRAFT_176290 [Lactarius akahatsu]|uniref:Uncharacterized protein n=1 Tax=Lactarius akahatsu TaxID=416441 RepID=A0AAD4Q3P8_9AGAM|nr:hypothetical protein EDB92DRAFT_176290 [Lactarius akahatsu]
MQQFLFSPYISHCYISKSIVETTSNSDHIDEKYRVVTSKNRPNPSHVYAEFDERVDVDSSGGRQGATTLSTGLKNDAASTLSERIELSESRAPRDGEDSKEESEEIPLAEIHKLGKKNSLGSVARFSSYPVQSLKWAAKGIFPSYTSPTYITEVVSPIHYILDTGWGRCVLAEGARHQGHNVPSIGDAETVTPPFLPGYRHGYSAPTDGAS